MYTFPKTLPIPNEPTDMHYAADYYLWKDCADGNLVQSIIELGKNLSQLDAKIGSGHEQSKLNESIRKSSISWIDNNPTSKFLFDFLIDKINRINFHHYGMNLTSMEDLQYTRYTVGGHYKFHKDLILKNKSMRKLSIVLALTDKDEYTGGEFLIMPHGENPTKIKFSKGDLIAFPSWVPHKVNPVTQGFRATIVTWVYGPYFV